jgi:hypothetical protein
VPVQGRREGKEIADAGEQMIGSVKKQAEHVYHAACDACHTWRHYPKLLTTVLLLSSFLIGAGLMGGVQKTGIMGKGGNYISAHWDRNTADAHHALDVILDHLQHPELYESSKHGVGIVKTARNKIGDFVQGILPASWGSRKMMRGGRDYGRDVTKEMEYGVRGAYDKLSDIGEDLSYGMRRGVEQAKDTTYGIGSKMSEMAESVKNKFVPSGRDYVERGKEHLKRGGLIHEEEEEPGFLGGLLGGRHAQRGGGRRGYEDEDEVDEATKKLRRVVRQADRDL